MCLKYSSRPFKTIEEQFNKLVENFNSILIPGDVLYVLGDTSITTKGDIITLEFLKKLKATEFHLISGNHDTNKIKRLKIWTSVSDIKEVKDGKCGMVLCHYPMAIWNRKHYGSIHLHGHSHGRYISDRDAMLDVGVDPNNFFPLLVEDIHKKLGVE